MLNFIFIKRLKCKNRAHTKDIQTLNLHPSWNTSPDVFLNMWITEHDILLSSHHIVYKFFVAPQFDSVAPSQ